MNLKSAAGHENFILMADVVVIVKLPYAMNAPLAVDLVEHDMECETLKARKISILYVGHLINCALNFPSLVTLNVAPISLRRRSVSGELKLRYERRLLAA